MNQNLNNIYEEKKLSIQNRLNFFKKVNKDEEQFKEMVFCLLTPQSNAQKCWKAVEEVFKLGKWDKENVSKILEQYTRFHNNKTRYVLEAKETWEKIKPFFKENDKIKLRNLLADEVKGYGLKEAGHFLRNIGKSDNQIAILDRHILRNLKQLGVIDDDKIKGRKNYLELEQKFLAFSREINIPIDELDLLFWSKENGEIFK